MRLKETSLWMLTRRPLIERYNVNVNNMLNFSQESYLDFIKRNK